MRRKNPPAEVPSLSFFESAMTLPRKVIDPLPGTSTRAVVTALSAREVDEVNSLSHRGDDVDGQRFMALMVSRSLRTEDGERLIPEGMEDRFFDMNVALVRAVTAAVLELNGMGPAEGN